MKRPISTINPRIGDASFVAAFGRAPTPRDAARVRVATHVGYVARRLRERDVSHLPRALRARRAALLDALDTYVTAGAFPDGEAAHGLLPTFLDAHTGVRCAVAHLVETSAGTALMTALDRDHHNAYIDDLAGDPRFVAWTAGSGLAHDELAWIQPSYPAPTPPAQLQYQLAADVRVAAARAQPDAPGTVGLLDGMLRYEARDPSAAIGTPWVELDGAIGVTNGAHAAYDAAAKLGTTFWLDDWHASLGAGVGVDAYGPAVPRAWTLPVEGATSYRFNRDELGVHGDLRPALAGARDLGWNLGVELRRLDAFGRHGRGAPRDLVVSLDATHVAGSTFLGLTLGVANPSAFRHWWEE